MKPVETVLNIRIMETKFTYQSFINHFNLYINLKPSTKGKENAISY